MKAMKILLPGLIMLILFGKLKANAQIYTQNIRGKVMDSNLDFPLIGANVILLSKDEFKGASTDINGNFTIENVKVGRHSFKISYLGYEDQYLSNISVNSGKETFLEIKLVEKVLKMKEVVIKADANKAEVRNDMALISARSFTVEETQRYAGSFNDPARMAQSYAGVAVAHDGSNELVIRGNNPKGMLWRLEGIEIPAPSHFMDQGQSGGPINMLPGTMMANSDFYTGAFSAEYGNSLSGVFDINLRKGNTQKREYTLQAGLLGLEGSIEGPFKKGYGGSYLANYRFSSTAALQELGIFDPGDGIPVWQDLSWNVNLPTKKAGNFTLFGLGGISSIDEEWDNYSSSYFSNMLTSGITHSYLVDKTTLLKTVVAFVGSESGYIEYEIDSINKNKKTRVYEEDFLTQNIRATTSLKKKINSKNTLKIGVIYGNQSYDLFSEYTINDQYDFETDADSKGSSALVQGYANWQHRFNDELIANLGAHYMNYRLNDKYSFEPRAAIKWQLAGNQTLSAGFGIHSKLDDITVYLAQLETENGLTQPNKNLEIPKATHFVVGYNYGISENMYVKVEAYYQDLFNIGVERDVDSYYSRVNELGMFDNTPLKSTGTGTNYGVELTLERFLSNSYYFMLTASLYDSKYKGSDGKEHNTIFNAGYASNLLAGKEWNVGDRDKGNVIGASFRGVLFGGNNYIPIDLDASIAAGRGVYEFDKAYEANLPDYMKIDIQVYYKRNRKRMSSTIKLDMQNATNRVNEAYRFYSSSSESIVVDTHLGLLPVLSYVVQF